MLGYFLYVCEDFGTWPQLLGHVHIVLLAKPTGGYRPIALLPSIYRIWAKARVSWVRSWASQLCRSYLALEAQKWTTDVAARVLVQAEGEGCEGPDSPASVRAIMDFEPCSDKVAWVKLRRVADVFGFPGQLTALAVRMYMGLAGFRGAIVSLWKSVLLVEFFQGARLLRLLCTVS